MKNMQTELLLFNKVKQVCLLQVFPGDVRVAGGSSPWRGSAQSKNVSSQRGQPLSAKLGVDEI